MNQELSSANTSINSNKVPAIFKKIKWKMGTKNLDWGGGKYDTATIYLKELNCSNTIYDPYNRSEEENNKALKETNYDSVTISNVLNVIKEKENRINIVREALKYIKEKGKVYISIYEGDKSGVGRISKKDCYQCNKKTREYLLELSEFNPVLKNNIIIIEKK